MPGPADSLESASRPATAARRGGHEPAPSAADRGPDSPNGRKDFAVKEFHHIGIPVKEKKPEMGYFESIFLRFC